MSHKAAKRMRKLEALKRKEQDSNPIDCALNNEEAHHICHIQGKGFQFHAMEFPRLGLRAEVRIDESTGGIADEYTALYPMEDAKFDARVKELAKRFPLMMFEYAEKEFPDSGITRDTWKRLQNLPTIDEFKRTDMPNVPWIRVVTA